MPRFPDPASSIAALGGSVFSALAHRLATHEGEVYPLHVGDTWLEPADGCRMQDLTVAEHPGMHRYASPKGDARLIAAVAERVTQRSGVPTSASSVLISAGATGGLGAVFGAIVDPGDEVLILAPYWPLIVGIVRCARGVPVEVPTLGAVDSAEALVQQLEKHRSSRSVALYLSTPNNPTGFVFPSEWVERAAEWAASHGMWIVADEVYEDYVFDGQHVYARSIAPERTFSAHSFSKAFGMAGNRCGYIVGPEAAMGQLCKVSTHSFYSTPTASQIAALRALDGRGDAWVARVREEYLAAGRQAAARLGLDPPGGGTFLFLDVADRLDQRGLLRFMERCADRGLFLAPGPSFGPYPTHVRLCFTCSRPSLVARGVEVLAELAGR